MSMGRHIWPGRQMEVSAERGYALWASFYDCEKNPLIAVEEPHVAKLLATCPYSRVLDAAAGTARHALRLARQGGQVVATDISAEMLEAAKGAVLREGLKLDLLLASLRDDLPFAPHSFDLVVCALALTHLPDLGSIMQEFHRVLGKEGHLLVTDFHPDSVAKGWRTTLRKGGTLYRLPNVKHTRTDYLEAIKNAGFSLLRTIDVPLSEVPRGYLPRILTWVYRKRNLCLVILGQKQ